MELICAAMLCQEPAKVIVGGYSLCGDHQGDSGEVSMSYMEQVTAEQMKGTMESMISKVMPVLTEFIQSGELERLFAPLRNVPPVAPEDVPTPE